jgi:hypothetical protein
VSAFLALNPVPLCDLRDLCAMLSPLRLFLARSHQVPAVDSEHAASIAPFRTSTLS